MQQVELLDGPREDARAVAAGAIADDGELEGVRLIVGLGPTDKVSGLFVEVESGRRRLRPRPGNGGAEKPRDANDQEEASHVVLLCS